MQTKYLGKTSSIEQKNSARVKESTIIFELFQRAVTIYFQQVAWTQVAKCQGLSPHRQPRTKSMYIYKFMICMESIAKSFCSWLFRHFKRFFRPFLHSRTSIYCICKFAMILCQGCPCLPPTGVSTTVSFKIPQIRPREIKVFQYRQLAGQKRRLASRLSLRSKTSINCAHALGEKGRWRMDKTSKQNNIF